MRHAWNIRIGAVLLSLAALAAWSNSFHGAFVLDDIPTIVANPSIRRLGALGTVLSPPKIGSPVTGRPLVNLTLALNYAASGTQVWSYHALNLLIHLLAGLTLFGVVRRTLEQPIPCGRSLLAGDSSRASSFQQSNTLPIAFAVALLWTVHPLQTEAVTYIVQRAESLAALFYLLTLYCTIRGATGADFRLPNSEFRPRASNLKSEIANVRRRIPKRSKALRAWIARLTA